MKYVIFLLILLLTNSLYSGVIFQATLPEEYGTKVQPINPAIGYYDGTLLYAWKGELQEQGEPICIYGEDSILIRLIWNGYHNIGEKGGVLTPFMFWDLDGDGNSELILRTGKAGTDQTYLTIMNPITGETLGETEFPDVVNWNYNQVHYLTAAYLDGYTLPPSIVTQVHVHSYERKTAFDTKLHHEGISLTKRWEIIEDASKVTGSGHGIWVFDADQNGDDEVLFGTTFVDGDGSILTRGGGADGVTLGHSDFTSIGDILPDEAGLEVVYCLEGRSPTKTNGVYVTRLSDGKILWEDTSMGHTDWGWLVDVADSPGLEIGAWSKTYNRFKLYASDGQVLFQEDNCPFAKYAKVLRWLGNKKAQVMIVSDGTHRKLAEWNGSWDIIEENFFNGYIIPHRYTKGDFWGDSRDELITHSGRTVYVFTNSNPPQMEEPSIRDNINYWQFVSVGAASYTYYPYWLYGVSAELLSPVPPIGVHVK